MTVADIKGAPLAVWDVREPGWRRLAAAGACEWAIEHLGQDAANRTYRIEFRRADGAPCAALYQFAVNEDGRKVHDPAIAGPARAEPVVQMLDELPPDHLMGR